MRKSLRMLFLALVVLVVPAANAREEIQCVPGEFRWVPALQQWRCTFTEEGTHCLLCGYSITVLG